MRCHAGSVSAGRVGRWVGKVICMVLHVYAHGSCLVSCGQTLPGRKGLVQCLVQCLTWVCILQPAHRQLTKYLPTATVFDHSFHTSGVHGVKLQSCANHNHSHFITPPIICGVLIQMHVRHWTRPFLWVGLTVQD